MASSSQYPEEKFIYEDLDVVRNYINLAFADASARNVNAQDVPAKGGSVKESSVKEGSAGGVSATCSTPWLLLQ